jgi:flagellar hook-associated protein 3 FlgL
MDRSLDQVLVVRASVGSRMVELSTLESVGSDLDIQYTQTLSRLQDVDYAEAVSNLTLQQTYLQASQQSFLRINQLSLFNYLS